MDGAVHRMWNHDPEQVRAFHDQTSPRQTMPHADPEGPTECTYHPDVIVLGDNRNRE